MTKPTQNAQDLKNDLWLMLSLAVSSKEFISLPEGQRSDIVNTAKQMIESLPTS
jgi:hypothetical protein